MTKYCSVGESLKAEQSFDVELLHDVRRSRRGRRPERDAPLTAVGPGPPGTLAPMPTPDLADPSLYFNRELSWLAFNRRVLDEAQDASRAAAGAAEVPGDLREQPRRVHDDPLRRPQGAAGGGRHRPLVRRPHRGRAAGGGLRHAAPMVLEHRRVLRDDVLPALAATGWSSATSP
jgi:hypothetical protein